LEAGSERSDLSRVIAVVVSSVVTVTVVVTVAIIVAAVDHLLINVLNVLHRGPDELIDLKKHGRSTAGPRLAIVEVAVILEHDAESVQAVPGDDQDGGGEPRGNPPHDFGSSRVLHNNVHAFQNGQLRASISPTVRQSAARNLTQTGEGASITRPVGDSSPVFELIRNTAMLFVD
jgi:hypothetical protein